MSERSGGNRFLGELKRRRVFRVAGGYLVAAFVALQVGDLVVEPLGMPEWTMTLLIVLAAVGFPVAMGLAWAFDLTPEGVQREAAVTGAATVGGRRFTPSSAGWVGLGMVVALVGFGGYTIVAGDDRGTELDRSVAVLPFADMSEAGNQTYFADGITEDILAKLAGVESLRVISRTSVMGYRGSPKQVREIGQELGVAYVVEGSVRRAGDRVRVTAQLIRADTDERLWADQFDRELEDVFAIQSDVAGQIVRALEVELGSELRDRLAAHGTSNIEAYDLYLRGREARNRNTESSADYDRNLRTADSLYLAALHLDPDYALAYASRATLWLERFDSPAQVRHDSTVALARRALDLDPDLPQAMVILGAAYMLRGQLDAAYDQFLAARRTAPNDPEVHGAMAALRWSRGELVEAVRHSEKARELEPTNVDSYVTGAEFMGQLGDIDEAERLTRKGVLEIDGHETRWTASRVSYALARGRVEEAVELAELLLTMPTSTFAMATAARAFLHAGNLERAKALMLEHQRLEPLTNHHGSLAWIEKEQGDTAVFRRHIDEGRELARLKMESGDHWAVGEGAIELFMIEAAAGNAGAAARALETAVGHGSRAALYIRMTPEAQGVLDDPAVAGILARVERENFEALTVLRGG